LHVIILSATLLIFFSVFHIQNNAYSYHKDQQIAFGKFMMNNERNVHNSGNNIYEKELNKRKDDANGDNDNDNDNNDNNDNANEVKQIQISADKKIEEKGDAKKKSEKQQKKGTVAVLGMHRSGTSAITGLLHVGLGLYVGPERTLMYHKKENAKGHFEQVPVVLADDIMLAANRGIFRFSPKKINQQARDKAYNKMVNVMEDYYKSPPYALKDPRMCITFEVYLEEKWFVPPVNANGDIIHEHISNGTLHRTRKLHDDWPIVALYVYRDPLEVATSLFKRDNAPMSSGLSRWYEYNCQALEHSHNVPRVTVFNTDVDNDPIGEMTRVAKELKSHGVHPVKIPSKEDVEEFWDTNLKHNKRFKEEDYEQLTTKQRLLWDSLQDGSALDKENPGYIAACKR